MGDLVYSSIASSNIPHAEKSAIRRWYDRVTGGAVSLGRAKRHVVETGELIRQVGESALAGAALGAAHAALPGGLDREFRGHKVPLDAVAAGAAGIAAVVLANDAVATELRNVAASAATVFAFRKTHDLIEQKRKERGEANKPIAKNADAPVTTVPVGVAAPSAPAKMSGESAWGEDPIITAARAL